MKKWNDLPPVGKRVLALCYLCEDVVNKLSPKYGNNKWCRYTFPITTFI